MSINVFDSQKEDVTLCWNHNGKCLQGHWLKQHVQSFNDECTYSEKLTKQIQIILKTIYKISLSVLSPQGYVVSSHNDVLKQTKLDKLLKYLYDRNK